MKLYVVKYIYIYFCSVIGIKIVCQTITVQVLATDDDPPENGGTVRYSTASKDKEGDLFHINEKTGEVTTRKVWE